MNYFRKRNIFNKLFVGFILVAFNTLTFAKKETITFIHTDHLGTPVLATNEDGSVKWRKDYQPFGKSLTNQDTDNTVGFTGHREDKELGLTYMQARWLHPEAGRFLVLDPIGYSDNNPIMSFNRYLYANNNPYKYTDPSGMCIWDACIAEGIIVIGIIASLTAIAVTQGPMDTGGQHPVIAPGFNPGSSIMDNTGYSTTSEGQLNVPWQTETPLVETNPGDLVQFNKKGKTKQPNTFPKKFRQEIEFIKRGMGVPRLENDGSQKEYEGRKHKRWAGGLEWTGPDGNPN